MDNLLPKKLNKKNDANAYKAVEDLINVLREAREEGIRNIALAGPFGAGKVRSSELSGKILKKKELI